MLVIHTWAIFPSTSGMPCLGEAYALRVSLVGQIPQGKCAVG
jgi:hypothetical protein